METSQIDARAERAGRIAARKGKKITDNPFFSVRSKIMWETAYMAEINHAIPATKNLSPPNFEGV